MIFFYEDVLRSLNKAKVDYVVFGAVAAILYGVHRATMDIDIMIDLEEKNIDRFFGVLSKLGYRARLPVTVEQFKNKQLRKQWINEKGMKVFTFQHKDDDCKIIDVSIGQLMNYKDAKKKIFKIKNLSIPVISLEQLKKMKQKAGRPKDLGDLDELNRLEKLL